MFTNADFRRNLNKSAHFMQQQLQGIAYTQNKQINKQIKPPLIFFWFL